MDSPDQIPFNELYRTGAPRDAVDEIRRALAFAELDAADALYDEAIHLAREGHLGKARDRLRMSLTLNPADGSAHLLLAKVFAAQHRWSQAIAELDAAAACGQRLPPGLKEALVESRDAEAGPRAPRVIRTDGEIQSLREETRRLRTEHNRMERRTRDLEHRAQVWSIATGVVTAVSALALLLVGLSWPGDEERAAAFGTEQLAEVELPEEDTPALVEPVVEPVAAPVDHAGIERVRRVETVATEPVTAYTVRGGDTLWKIAGRVYGDKARWKEIRDANKSLLEGKTGLQIGMVLEIPKEQS